MQASTWLFIPHVHQVDIFESETKVAILYICNYSEQFLMFYVSLCPKVHLKQVYMCFVALLNSICCEYIYKFCRPLLRTRSRRMPGRMRRPGRLHVRSNVAYKKQLMSRVKSKPYRKFFTYKVFYIYPSILKV